MAVLVALVVGTARLASAQYDPSLQFSPTLNPNGVWSYGFETVPLGSPFNLLTALCSNPLSRQAQPLIPGSLQR